MDSFEFNKYAGAAMGTLLFMVGLNYLTDALLSPKPLAEPVYIAPGFTPGPAKGDVKADAKAPAAPGAPAAPAESLGALLAKASAEAGKASAKKCAICHSFAKGEANKIGPNLWGALGGKKAAVAGFAYSAPLTALGGTWSYQDIDKYIENPKAFAPGNKMAFAGIASAKERADILSYLRTLADSPLALPNP
jgi:cytochrome c